MAVSQNEMSQYQSDWLQVQGCSTYGYGLRVLQRLGWPDDPKGRNRRKVHNVYAGILKDRLVLDAIRAELLSTNTENRQGLERSILMVK
jgi:hypothetical protein